MNATVQVAKSVSLNNVPHKRRRRILIATAVITLAAGLTLWWKTSGRNYILRTVDPYRVTGIDAGAHTMTLVHGNRRYVVRCDDACDDYFQDKNFYRMNDAGAVLEHTDGKRHMSLPIIQEEITFDVTGGHG